MNKMMTTQEVADYLQVEHRWLLRQIRAGEFPVVQLSERVYRVRPEDLDRYIAERMVRS